MTAETPDELRRRIFKLTEENTGLAEKVAARDSFLAFAAHELRNPMTPMISRVAMLRRAVGEGNVQPEKLARSLDEIEWLIRHFIRRATTLLDVSRITTGKLRLERTEVDICVVVRQVAATLDPIARYSGSPIGLDLPAGGLSVLGDGLAIEQIVDNLVSNAIKYGGGKPIIVNVTADATIGAARMSVKDGGPGISADSQARIFERFERAVPAAEHKAGFGVGLWIVRQLVEAMNGMIAVTSTPGLGSAFCVILPMKPMKDSHEHDVA